MGYPHKSHPRETPVLSKHFGDPEARTLDGWKARGGYKALQQALHMEPTAIDDIVTRWGRLDVLHNNVGISVAGNDAAVEAITTEAFDRIVAVNLRGMVYSCKYAIPVMRKQESGVIINISSMAAWSDYPWVGYKTTKAAIIALTEQIAIQNARFGVRANVILPGLMDTPMAVDTRARAFGRPRAEVAAERDAQVPLRGKMGTAWDVAYAALFLASDEANFITGVALPVDGGMSVRVG